MESLKTALQEICKRMYLSANIYMAIILIFCYHVFLEKEFACSCKPQATQCNLYMGLPFLVLTLLIFWTDKAFQRYWRYFLSTCKTRLCGALWSHTLKAVFVGLLWVASVLIDGDWWVCCKNNQTQLACKKKNNISAEEQAIIAELKNQSRIYGLTATIVVTFVAAILTSLKSLKYEKFTCCKKQDRLKCCKKQNRLNELILEEEEKLLEKALKNAVKQKLTADFDACLASGRWEKCFDIADKLMEDQTGSSSSEQQGEQNNQDEGDPPPPENQPPVQQEAGPSN